MSIGPFPSITSYHSTRAVCPSLEHCSRPTVTVGSDVLIFRHGWGCTPDPAEAVKYLSAAASNAASIEDLALQAGLKKGGAAKGELVLAIFELANCFRHGWGVQVDKVAAKQVRPSYVLDGEASYVPETDS